MKNHSQLLFFSCVHFSAMEIMSFFCGIIITEKDKDILQRKSFNYFSKKVLTKVICCDILSKSLRRWCSSVGRAADL